MNNYKHINDCWEALENKSYSQMLSISDDFPRWSGNWSFDIIDIDDEEMTVEVSNICYNEATQEEEETHYNFEVTRCSEDDDYYELYLSEEFD